jgi:bifunctional oligoribonuclease and PAP phosphatase NrnA
VSIADVDLIAAQSAFEKARSIVLACHVNPDGDALGSMLALLLGLTKRYPDKYIEAVSHDGVPDIYEFLPAAGQIKSRASAETFDLAIALDSGDVKRTGDQVFPVFAKSLSRMDIDHHVGDGAFGDVRLLDSKAAATAEIVFDLLGHLGINIDTDIATCLLTGVITDTGSFRFMNVTPRTLRTAATLIEAGATPSLIAERVFDNRTFPGTKLLGLCLSTLQICSSGHITYASVKHEHFAETDTLDQDTEGFINFVRSIRGSEVAILFREFELGTVRISLRSTERVDVARIANQFNGGGHKMAAGCTYYGALVDAQAAILEAVSAALPPS